MNACTCPTCGQGIDPLDIHIDEGRGSLSHQGVEIHLTPQQMRLLAALWGAYPRVLSRSALRDALTRPDDPNGGPIEKIVDVMINMIRPRLDAIGIRIVTHRGVGFAMELGSEAAAARTRALARQRGVTTECGLSADDLLRVAGFRARRLPLSDIARRTGLTFAAVRAAFDDLDRQTADRREASAA